jgi:hypothetical protein
LLERREQRLRATGLHLQRQQMIGARAAQVHRGDGFARCSRRFGKPVAGVHHQPGMPGDEIRQRSGGGCMVLGCGHSV